MNFASNRCRCKLVVEQLLVNVAQLLAYLGDFEPSKIKKGVFNKHFNG